MSTVAALYARAGTPVPAALADWGLRVAQWCDEYRAEVREASLTEINLGFALFLFDVTAERVTLAYALAAPALLRRDKARLRGFPDVNVGVQAVLGERAIVADRGHFLGHASGGELDINLFPHRRELNQGRSTEGRRFRLMEKHVADHPGCFFYHRPIYDDGTWIPARLEYGVLRHDTDWWVDTFDNK